MRIFLTINEALRLAKYTGQQVRITLNSGNELIGIVEELWQATCRLWVNPQINISPGLDVEKAVIAIPAIHRIAFDNQSYIEDTLPRKITGIYQSGIRDAVIAAYLTRQIVEIALYCNGQPRCVEGYVEYITNLTFYLDIRNSCKDIKERFANVEYVLFR